MNRANIFHSTRLREGHLKGILIPTTLALAFLSLMAPRLQSQQSASRPSALPSSATAVEEAGTSEPQMIEDLKKSAEASDPIAENNLGYDYAFGKGVPQSFREAATWLSAAASQGFAPAEINLGALYEKGWIGHIGSL